MRLSPALARAWRAAPWLLAAVVLALVLRQAMTLDWPAVGQAIADLPPTVLAGAALAAAAGHLAFAGFDVVARAVLRHGAGAWRSAWIGATAYAMNLNLGALIGGVAIRLDLYRRAGVGTAQAVRVVGLGMVANWCGWALLGAAVLVAARPLPWPPAWGEPRAGLLSSITAVCVVLPAAVLLACALRQRLPARWRRFRQELPPWPAALAGVALGLVSWSLAATTLWWLLQGALPWWTVAGALLLAAVAGVVTHVPGGLGVLEAVVLATLSPRVDTSALLAALLAYRAVYYGLPLLVATASYAGLLRCRGPRGGPHRGPHAGPHGAPRQAQAGEAGASPQGAA